MSLPEKVQVANDAAALLQRFQTLQAQINQMTPNDQIQAAETLKESEDAFLLNSLQIRTQATYTNRANAIPNMTDNEASALSTKLANAQYILEAVDKNEMIAFEVNALADEVNELFNAAHVNPNVVALLKERVRKLETDNVINSGNLDALHEISQKIAAKENGVVQQSSPIVNSNPVSTPVQSTRNVMAEQDENFKASSFVDQLKDLDKLRAIPNDVLFGKVLEVYKEAKKYSQETQFLLSANKDKIAEVLRQAERKLNTILSEIEATENTQATEVQSSSESDFHGKLESLKEALENLCAEVVKKEPDILTANKNVSEAISTCSYEEKNKIFQELNTVLNRAQKTLPGTLVGNFGLWGGSNAKKLEAVNNLLAKCAPQNPSAQNAPVVEKMSEKLRSCFETVKNANFAPIQSQSQVNTNSNVRTNRDAIVTSTPVRNNSNSSVSTEEKMIQELQQILILMQENGSYKDLQTALECLTTLELKDLKALFKVSNGSAVNVASRPCFHLYCIHKAEGGIQNPEDAAYGMNAMAGFYEVTNLDRSRAVSRTIVELALEGLENGINLQHADMVKTMLQILENTHLVQSDMPEGKNAAHALFGFMYNKHCSARNANKQLIDPHHSQFNSDFGRNVFACFQQNIDSKIKIESIGELRQALKAAWKL